MQYPEWDELEQINDPENPFCNLYRYEDGSSFYVEPAFYTQLQGFKLFHPGDYFLILRQMERLVKINHNVIFTAEYESPFTHKPGFVLLEINDITDPLKIFVQDISRGSDYGD